MLLASLFSSPRLSRLLFPDYQLAAMMIIVWFAKPPFMVKKQMLGAE